MMITPLMMMGTFGNCDENRKRMPIYISMERRKIREKNVLISFRNYFSGIHECIDISLHRPWPLSVWREPTAFDTLHVTIFLKDK